MLHSVERLVTPHGSFGRARDPFETSAYYGDNLLEPSGSRSEGHMIKDTRLAAMSAVTHRYGGVVALDGLDLEIRAGEVLAVLGPNGAGKTTAIGLLLGTLRAQEGTVRVFGHEPGADAVRMRRGAMLQVSGLPDTLTVAENLELFSSYYPAPLPVFPDC